MISDRQIQELAQQIAEQFHPEKIILFGSYAYGVPHSGSDIDLLLVMQFEGRAIDLAGVIWNAIRPSFPIDLIIKSPEEVIWRYKQCDPLVRMAVDYGRILYDRSMARVG